MSAFPYPCDEVIRGCLPSRQLFVAGQMLSPAVREMIMDVASAI